MKELTLQEIKKIELEILQEFDNFCKENNIRYYLSNGTLLGAVKYKGFIPWDDDIDVFVPRKDYERLFTLFEDNEHYRLFAFEKDSKYRYPFAKLCDMTTRKLEGNIDNGVTLGIDIDIFPLDTWSESYLEAKKEVIRIKKNMFFLNLTKMKKTNSVNPIKRMIQRILILLCKIYGGHRFIENILKTVRKPEGRNYPYVGCKTWCIYGEREIIPSTVFESTVDVEFEGMIFPAPIGYDTYLRSLYGDYLQDPPIEKQKTHHIFKAYRL